ncbi:MAG: hypothetical protein A49_28200 [Methyloceanibacter sp.]|nr:MAG: hypothetical protein A49_28200 [Methyloceanibacter sp.]
MDFLGKVVASICASAIGGGITLYFGLNVMVASWLDIAASNSNHLGIALIIAGAIGLLTFATLYLLQSRKPQRLKKTAVKEPSKVEQSTPDQPIRIPYVKIREMANEHGWQLTDNQTPSGNRAYALERLMRQAAVDGKLKVWGRRCTKVTGTNPLLAIPANHFDEFEFAHGYLHPDNVKNENTHTGKLGRSRHDFAEKNFCDLYVARADIERILSAPKPDDPLMYWGE